MKNKYFRVGSDGFIALKDYMGSDETIEQSARISYGAGTRKRSETRGLIRYLLRMKHTSPFEQAELQFHIKVPMHVWRQQIRHRTANVNEYSTRYSVAIDDVETTKPEEWRTQSQTNKQGSSGFIESWDDVEDFDQEQEYFETVKKHYDSPGQYLTQCEQDLHIHAKYVYDQRLKMGVAREQARKDLPLSNYTEAFWKMDLHNLLHFLRLRLDPHAQKEIRDYAYIIACIVKELFPLTWEAFEDYALNSISFTGPEKQIIQDFYDSDEDIGYMTNKEIERINEKNNGILSKREISELNDKIEKLFYVNKNKQEFILPESFNYKEE